MTTTSDTPDSTRPPSDALQALVNLDGCASTIERLAETAIVLHQDCRLAEALIFLSGTIRQNRDVLRPLVVADCSRREKRKPAPVVALRAEGGDDA